MQLQIVTTLNNRILVDELRIDNENIFYKYNSDDKNEISILCKFVKMVRIVDDNSSRKSW